MSRSIKRKIKQNLLPKLLNPANWWRAKKLGKTRKKGGTEKGNTQLQLYSQILPGDFLHYGYFDDSNIKPEEVSIAMFEKAQLRYAELILEHLPQTNLPLLDVGCGMGGLLHLLSQHGYEAVGLTPDKYQIAYVGEKYPDTELIQAKFEEIDLAKHKNRYDCVINSESIQYLILHKALKVVEEILAESGKWIVIDYFRTGEATEKSGLRWDVFLNSLQETGFHITYEQDITENVRPTLSFLYMWGQRLGLPLLNFGIKKLEQKRPGTYYFLEETVGEISKYAEEQIDIINPDKFVANKKYVLLVIERQS